MRCGLLASAILALLAGGAYAQPADAPGGFTTLFISPSGEPYRGRPDEPYPIVFWFNQTDTNHDGAIDRTEFRADAMGFFQFLDHDRDNVLDGSEVGDYENRIVPDVLGALRVGQAGGLILVQLGSPGPSGQPNTPTRHDAQPLQGAGGYNLLRETEPLTAADTNLDGRITLAEFMEATDRRFRTLDANGDGKLQMAEFPKTVVQAAAEAKRR